MTRPTNRLADATSPYLRQHAHNPVDWYPWGEAALARAKAEDKPIFLSIGYSACHWCHVMERESFEDPATAALMNELFVCIKVDREERPDLDEIYMTAVQAMTGQGGWPMSVWLTPDLEPFYGGTYFPPTDAYGRPGFPRVLSQLGKAWKDRREDCVAGSKQLTQHLRDALQASTPAGDLPADLDQRLRGQSEGHFDGEHGGFGAAPQFAPKFPHASELDVLLQLGAKGDAAALRLATVTLDAMAHGGIYDQLGGGFHRYSTDREWLVPHFEKMLYDNAQLAGTYLRASVITGSAEYARIGRETLDYMLREMRGAEGGFFSSQDADSEGVEGKFFVWQRDEFTALLGADAALAIEHFGVTAGGNWEHANVLTLARDRAALAQAHGLPAEVVAERLTGARAQLLAARNGRVHPGTDDKVLAAWCAMAIKACAEGYQVLGDERYLDAAQRAAAFVLEQMVRDGRLLRSWRAGTAQHAAYLEDHAFLADALLTLFESDFDPRWLAASSQLLATMRARFRADDGSFYFTADDHETLLARSKNVTESSTPSGQGVAARALLRAGLLLGDEALYADGLAVLRANAALLQRAPVACPSLVLAWQFQAADPREIVIAGPLADPRTRALLQAARSRAASAQVVGVVHDGNRAALEELSSVFEGKGPVRGAPALYRCRRGSCEAPITDPEQLR